MLLLNFHDLILDILGILYFYGLWHIKMALAFCQNMGIFVHPLLVLAL